ncbi:MAG: hypothetical protein R3D66_04900 [Alphaproteobacteria bacterium]
MSEAFPPIPGMRLSSIDLMVPDPPERRTVRMLPYDKSSEIAASLILDEGEQDYACIPSVN